MCELGKTSMEQRGLTHSWASVTSVAAARPSVSSERPWRRAVVAASAVALLCLAASSATAAGPLNLLESFDNGPDPDAPGGTRYFTSDYSAVRGERPGGQIPSGVQRGPRQQDYYYRHVYTYKNYPHPYGGTAVNSENSVQVQRLHRVTGEIRSAEQHFAQIDRQRAGKTKCSLSVSTQCCEQAVVSRY
jgi:hypothetical protein